MPMQMHRTIYAVMKDGLGRWRDWRSITVIPLSHVIIINWPQVQISCLCFCEATLTPCKKRTNAPNGGPGSLGVREKGSSRGDLPLLVALLTIVPFLVQMHNRGVLQLKVGHFCRPRGMEKCRESFNKALAKPTLASVPGHFQVAQPQPVRRGCHPTALPHHYPSSGQTLLPGLLTGLWSLANNKHSITSSCMRVC